MAEEKEPTVEEGEEVAEGGGKGKKLLTALVAIVALAAGAGVGLMKGGDAVGPVLADRAQAAEAGGGHDDGHGGGGGEAPIHLIDNLVVNPARSGGTRFLLVSIAIEAPNNSMVDAIAARDVQIRSALIMVLGAKSTEELSDIENRPDIADEIGEAIGEILGPDAVKHVFIPQFVIQ